MFWCWTLCPIPLASSPLTMNTALYCLETFSYLLNELNTSTLKMIIKYFLFIIIEVHRNIYRLKCMKVKTPLLPITRYSLLSTNHWISILALMIFLLPTISVRREKSQYFSPSILIFLDWSEFGSHYWWNSEDLLRSFRWTRIQRTKENVLIWYPLWWLGLLFYGYISYYYRLYSFLQSCFSMMKSIFLCSL